MPFPIYEVSEFPNGVAENRLHLEMKAASFSVPFLGLVGVDNTIEFRFDGTPTQDDETTADAVVAAHSGQPIPSVSFIASTKLVETSRVISSSDWELMGGVVTNPGFFDSDLNHLMGRIVGQLEADGEIEMRLVENQDGDEQVMCSPVWTLGPKATPGSFQTNTNVPPRAGENAFRLEARLTTATVAKLYFTSLTLLKVV